jgi:outer membrane protein with beta-barrel domain
MLAPVVSLASAVLLLGAGSRVGAQSFGIMLGKTNSDVLNFYNGQLTTSYPDRHAYTEGVTYRLRILPGVALEPELLRVQRGWAEQSHPTLSLTYVELPVLLRFGGVTRGGWPVLPTFSVGSSIAWATSCALTNPDLARVEGTGCDQRIAGSFSEDYGINRVDFGAILGVGMEFRVAHRTLVGLEGRYELGLTDIRRDPTQTSHNSTLFVVATVVPRLNR